MTFKETKFLHRHKPTDKETDRQYYFDIDGEKVPNTEAMIAYLLDEDVLFADCRQYYCEYTKQLIGPTIVLFVLVNDYFVPASDAEDVKLSEIPQLFELYRKGGMCGVYEFVAEKRGIPNKHWREKL
jgi:hypothetical protein